jgi:hypothetical protein
MIIYQMIHILRNLFNEISKQLRIAGITLLRYCIDVLSQIIASSTDIHQHVG